MKSTIESLKTKTGSGYVRAVTASAVLVPLAVVMGGTSSPTTTRPSSATPPDPGLALLERAVERRERRDLAAALDLAQAALATLEIEHGPDSSAVVQALILVGWIRQELEDHRDAERALRRAVDVAEQLRGGPELALLRVRALESLAASLRLQGRYDEAEALFRRALAEAEEEFGPDAAPVADVLGGLGVTFKYSGRFDEAESRLPQGDRDRGVVGCGRPGRAGDPVPQLRRARARACELRGGRTARAAFG